MPLFAAASLSIVAMTALAVDLSLVYLAKTRLQNAVDAAALSGAKSLRQFGSVPLATAAVQATFALNATKLVGVLPTVETSPTLAPFAAGGAGPRYVRVTATSAEATRFARVLPGTGETFAVSATAVAGPIGLGEICGAFPLALCGVGGDSDCSDGACYGLGGPGETTLAGHRGTIGAGNYGFVVLACSGGACLREALAGGGQTCFDPDGAITTEPGLNNGPLAQGVNTRFGIYSGGGLTPGEYPPDVVTASTPVILHDAYQARLANGIWNNPPPLGVPQRRVITVPVVDCGAGINGRRSVSVLGPACFFLTRPVSGGEVYGEFVGECLATGGVPEDPDDGGPAKIILFQNPDGLSS